MIKCHILAKSIILVFKKMQASCKNKQIAIKVRNKLDIAKALALSETYIDMVQNLHKSQIEAAKYLYKSQLTQARISTKKTVDKLIDCYIRENTLIIRRLEFIRNKYNIFIFILFSKVFNI